MIVSGKPQILRRTRAEAKFWEATHQVEDVARGFQSVPRCAEGLPPNVPRRVGCSDCRVAETGRWVAWLVERVKCPVHGVVCNVGALPGPGVNLSGGANAVEDVLKGVESLWPGNGVLDEIDCGWIAEKSGIHDNPVSQEHVSDMLSAISLR